MASVVLMQPTPNPRRSQLELFRPSVPIPQWTAMPSACSKTRFSCCHNYFASIGKTNASWRKMRSAMSDKIKSQHISRKALLYVRQSSTYQVHHNLESQKLQYAMRQRLHMLGWQDIEVIDEDLGRSAAGTVTRSGFERMVAEVCMGKVGAVAAREVSRFARNSREWQQLVEVCRVVDTI